MGLTDTSYGLSKFKSGVTSVMNSECSTYPPII